jgi:hypothetical protein
VIFEPLENMEKVPWKDALAHKKLSTVLELSDTADLRVLKSVRGLTIGFKITSSNSLNSRSKCETFVKNLRRLLELARKPTPGLFEPRITAGAHGDSCMSDPRCTSQGSKKNLAMSSIQSS